MQLQALLAEVDASWHAPVIDAHGEAGAALLAQARASALGRRLLARALAREGAGALFAPHPQREFAATAARWPRAAVAALARDLGVLAYAPAIRAEVGREPVRRLKRALGNSYLLALDRTVWSGEVEPALAAALARDLGAALAQDPKREDAVLALFDAQGRAELQAWARRRDPALADWAALLQPRAELPSAHLPEKPVLLLHTHHETRARAA